MIKNVWPFLFLLLVTAGFFYQTIFFGKMPFPGDLLIAEYVPWKFESYLGFNPGSYPHKAQYFDVLQQLYPWKSLVVDLIKSGQVPLWNPYNFSGSPLLANVQSAVFSPVTLLMLLLPKWIGWTLGVMLQPVLASIFTYLFVRRLGLKTIAALFSGVLYGYSLFMTVFLEYNTIGHVMALMPLSLYLFELIFTKKQFVVSVLFAFSLAFLFLVGHLQLALVAFVFVFAYAFFRVRNRRFFFFLPLFILGLLAAALQLLPTIELVLVSARSVHDPAVLIEKLLIQPWQLLVAFAPDAFGNPVTRNFLPNETYPTKAMSIGVIGLLLAFQGFFVRKGFATRRFFLTAIAILLLFLIRNPISELFYNIEIPLVSTSSPSNMLFLVAFCLSIFAGVGLQSWMEKRISRKAIGVFASALVVSLLLAITHKEYLQQKMLLFSGGVLTVGVVLLFFVRFKTWPTYLALAIVFVAVIELGYFFQKFNPFVSPELLYPTTTIDKTLQTLSARTDRIVGFENSAVAPNIQTELRTFSPNGYDPLYPRWYGELFNVDEEGIPKLSFDSFSRSNVTAPFNQSSLSAKLINTLGVSYIIDRSENGSSEEQFPSERFEQIATRDEWRFYKNSSAILRANPVVEYIVSDNAVEAFFSDNFDPKTHAILSEDPALDNPSQIVFVSQLVASANANKYIVRGDGESILVISDTYYPGWKAYINGEETPVFRANNAFRAVVVPEGEWDIVFYYWPKSFVIGMVISIISIVGVLFTSYIVSRRLTR